MRSLFRNLFQSPMRNATAEEAYIFAMHSVAGGVLSDEITGTLATIAISGTRYGIVNGVVTAFAANQPPIEDDGLRGCPAFTQLAKFTEDLTNAAWGKINILAPILVGTFQNSAIYKIIESADSNNQHYIQQLNIFGLPTDNSILGICLLVKKDLRSMIRIDFQDKNSLYPVIATINLNTGLLEAPNSGTTYLNITPLQDGFYRIFLAANAGVGGSTNPRFRIMMYNGINSIYNGDGASGLFVSQPTFINFGVNGIPFIPPYVPNNTTGSIAVVSEAATATTGISYDLDKVLLARLKTALRGPNAQGHLELTFKSNVDSGWVGNGTNIGLFTVNNNANNSTIYYRKLSGGDSEFYAFDSATNNISINVSPLTVGQTLKISLDWGTHSTGQKMRITVNGVKSTLGNFSGSFGTQDLRFFFGNTVHAGWIVKDSLKISDRPQW